MKFLRWLASASAISLALVFLFTPSTASATPSIVYYCAITSSSSHTAPASGTVLVSCPSAIPANTLQAGDTIEWEVEGEESANSSGGGTTGYKFFLSSNDMIGVNNGCQSTLANDSHTFVYTYRGWDTLFSNGSSGTSGLAYECLMTVNGTTTPFRGDNNPGFDTTVALTPEIEAGRNFPSGSTTQVFTFIVKIIR
jgi:hypothetical protein